MARKAARSKGRGGTAKARPKTAKRSSEKRPADKRTEGRAKETARVGERTRPPEPAAAAVEPDLPKVTPADLSGLVEGKRYYRIGEVSQITGIKAYVLRYWESEFRLMAPQKSRSQQRLYRQKDIETILHIKRLLYEERYTIAGARKKLRELGAERVREESQQRHQLTSKSNGRSPSKAPAKIGLGSPPKSGANAQDQPDGEALPPEGILEELREIRSVLAADL